MIYLAFLFLFTSCNFFEKEEPKADSIFTDSKTLTEDSNLQYSFVSIHEEISLSENLNTKINQKHRSINHKYKEIENDKINFKFKKYNQRFSLYFNTKFYKQNVPIVYKNYILTIDENGNIYSFLNKKEIWTLDLKGFMKNKKIFIDSFIQLIPEKNILIITINDGKILNVNLENGNINWQKDLNLFISNNHSCDDKNCYILTSEGTIYNLNIKNGNINWERKNDNSAKTMYLGNSFSLPILENEYIYYYNKDNNIVKINKKDGHILWSQRVDYLSANLSNIGINDIDHEMIIYKEYLIGGSSLMNILFALNKKNGSVVWVNDFKLNSEILQVDNFGFFLSNENNLCCLDLETGRIKWITRLEDNIEYKVPRYLSREKNINYKVIYNSPIMVNGEIWLNNYFGELYRVNPQNGSIIEQKEDLQPFIAGSFIILNSKIIAADKFGAFFIDN